MTFYVIPDLFRGLLLGKYAQPTTILVILSASEESLEILRLRLRMTDFRKTLAITS